MTISATAQTATEQTAQAVEEAVGEAESAAQEATKAAEDVNQQIEQAEEAEILEGVDSLRQSVSEQSSTIGNIVNQLDAFGFTVGDTRFSLWTALIVVLVIVGVLLFARLGTTLATKSLRRMTRLSASQRLLSEKLVAIVVWGIALLVGIDMLGIDLTALAFFSGAFGLAIGFGLQKTFGNLIAGIILLMDRSIKPGDVISVADSSGQESFGQIRKIGIRAISVVTRDRTEYLIPNEVLMINQVINWSYSSREVRVKAPVRVSYGSDLDLIEKLLLQAAKDVPRVLESPAPRVNLTGFEESSVNFEIRFWIMDPEEGMGNIRSDVFKRVWKLFQENEVHIPFPQRDLNLRDSEQFQQLVSAIAQRVEKKSDDQPPI